MQIGYKVVLTMVVTALEAPAIAAFLKRVGVLRRRTRGLFLRLFALSAALFAAFYLFRRLAATDAADLQAHYISPHDLDIAEALRLAANLLHGDHRRWWLRLAHLLSGVSLGALTYTATAFAAVSHHSGERHTLPSLLRKMKSNLLRPALTVAGACALRTAVVAAIAALAVAITGHGYILGIVMFPLLGVYAALQPVCAVAVVASVAEPGLCGKGAVARACRLMRGKYREASDCMTASSMLRRMFWLLCTLVAIAGLPLPAGGAVKCLLLVAEEMLYAAKVTGYYFDCRKRQEQEDRPDIGIDPLF